MEHFDNTSHERALKRYYRTFKSWFVAESVHPNDVDEYNYHSWTVKAAPLPEDIEWSVQRELYFAFTS